jgi:hypothetical protein
LKILFDQNTPRNLVRYLEGHDVQRAAQLHWEELKNGDLLQAAEAKGFDLFLTCDRNLGYQQNLQTRRIAIIAMSTNTWPIIKPHVDQVKMAVSAAMPGSYLAIECGHFIKRRSSQKL